MIESLDVAGLVGSVGFPITAFIMMFYFASSSLKKNTEAINDLKVAIASMRKK